MGAINQIFIIAVGIFYIIAAVFYWAGFKKRGMARVGFISAVVGLAANTLALISMTVTNQRLPLASSDEFLLSFVFITVLMYLCYEKISRYNIVGGAVMTIASLLSLIVCVQITGQAGTNSLMPALKSPWLTVHVLTAVVAYSGFALGAGMAAIQLTGKNSPDRDNSIYRIIAFGFAMLSLSIVLGAVWAEQAWGSYWSWDPKETWALVTWIIYAIYLHLHRQRGWRGKNSNLLIIAGFVLVLFTFFGVNYLMTGMHSYA
ncbi:MAG: cytochrome c biogenesis protein CcsA [Chitinophagales bacterium]